MFIKTFQTYTVTVFSTCSYFYYWTKEQNELSDELWQKQSWRLDPGENGKTGTGSNFNHCFYYVWWVVWSPHTHTYTHSHTHTHTRSDVDLDWCGLMWITRLLVLPSDHLCLSSCDQRRCRLCAATRWPSENRETVRSLARHRFGISIDWSRDLVQTSTAVL